MDVPMLSPEAAPPAVTLWSTSLAQHGLNALPRFTPPAPDPEHPYLLTCGKIVAYCHSQFRELAALRRHAPEPVAELAPDLAASLGIETGMAITIETATGRMHCTAELNPNLAGGTVWAQYGWWDEAQEINYNATMDGESFDAVSGSNALRGIACRVLRREPAQP